MSVHGHLQEPWLQSKGVCEGERLLEKEARHAGLPFAFHQHGLAQNDAERFQGSSQTSYLMATEL